MDIRYLIVGAPFIIAFFYTLFWLRKWGAFNSNNDNLSKKMTPKNESLENNYILENISYIKLADFSASSVVLYLLKHNRKDDFDTSSLKCMFFNT